MNKRVADRLETRLEANGKSRSVDKRKSQVYVYAVKGKYSFYSLLETLYFMPFLQTY
jgi:hypothetical protein